VSALVNGAFQTSREIFESTIWTDVVKFRIFFYIYGNAVFAKEGTNVAGIHLNRGQYLRSYRNLQNDLAFKEKRSYKIYPLTTLQRKINELVQEKRIEIQGTDYGTLFTVVNYDEYQGFERYEKSLVERNRNGTGTEPEQYRNNNKKDKKDKKDNNTSSSNDGKSKVEQNFELLWKLYPRKEGKDVARKAYKRAIKNGATNKAIQDGIVAYRKLVASEGRDKQYIRQGGTWFNQKGWEDEYQTELPADTSEQSRQSATDMNDLDKQQEENLRRAEEKYRKEHPELNE
jgi:hypothetical protein